MGKFDDDIKRAKQEVTKRRELLWKEIWAEDHNKPLESAPDPPPKELPQNWFTAQWGTGFIVMDLNELMKLKANQRKRILKLGGID